jgi:plastocyanin
MTSAKLFILTALGLGVFAYLRQFDLTQTWLNLEVSKNPIISFSKAGFSPKKIVIRVGTVVTFLNESEEDFWPASNIHPLNALYSEFDPKRPLSKGNKWLFKFEKVGEWGYHDHLHPNFSGTVIVIGKRIFNKKNTSCKDPSSLTYNQRQVCWYFEMKDILKKKGLDSAFARLSELFEKEPAFASGCHDVTHLIGDAA